MADAETETAPSSTTVRLQVAPARQEESGQGIARMPRSAFQKLGITEGDVVEITGKRSTPAIALPAYQEDESLDVIRLDGLQRGNAEVGSGEHVDIAVGKSRTDAGSKTQLFQEALGNWRSGGHHRAAAGTKHAIGRAPIAARASLRTHSNPSRGPCDEPKGYRPYRREHRSRVAHRVRGTSRRTRRG